MKKTLINILLASCSFSVIADTLVNDNNLSIEDEVKCMADNIYHEARNQSIDGMYAVGYVVMNRVNHSDFPRRIDGVIASKQQRTNTNACEVIYDGKLSKWNNAPLKYKCQFSWYCDGKSDKIKDNRAMIVAIAIATDIVKWNRINFNTDITANSLYYHTKKVNPEWNKTFEKVITIDDHIFYK